MTAAQASRPPGMARWAKWSLRVLAMAVTLLALVQPVLAGLFVTGDVGMLDLHGMIASFLVVLAFLQIIASILAWRPGRGPAWPVSVSIGIFVVIELQAALGYARAIALHIPVGVLLFGLLVALLIAVWSPRSDRRRFTRGRKDAR
ncbi:hypothetical protein [Rhizohabitans arisaemae]|uniref:hypothetical protein n=1 Tax=Rhizohabitans arisaemae TaxID=2720610 RepID=UPI0024B0A27D|nr:hypothetical protein [Rhizohabitans arisaemae]